MKILIERLSACKLIPVITLTNADDAVALAQILIDNGMSSAEVTFRTPAAENAIKQMRAAFPDLLIGAGTILTPQQADCAVNAGANFVVSPGFNPSLVRYCLDQNIAIIPGVNNPSLVEQAMEMGLRMLKFFPAEPSGGVPMLNALSAVYPVTFMPTGGITLNNVLSYLTLPSVIACGGSWMVPSDQIKNHQWERIAEKVRESVAHLKQLS